MKNNKRLVAPILAFGVMLACSMTSFAAELPEQKSKESVLAESSINQAAAEVYDRGIYAVKGEGVRLMEEAGTSGKTLALLYESKGDWVMIGGVEKTKDGIVWLQVNASSYSMKVTGWVAKECVDPDRIDA